jgi:hypothetical protein
MCCLHGRISLGIDRRRSGLIDLIRLFLLESDQIDDYKTFSECFSFGSWADLAEIEWTWFNAAAAFFRDVLIYIRKVLAEQLVGLYRLREVDTEPITQLLLKLLDDDMLNHYLSGTWKLFPNLFNPSSDYGSLDSDRVGGAYLDLLQRFGLNIESCVSSELERFPEGVMEAIGRNRKIIFEPYAIRGWILRWEWVYDPSESGYLVVSEYNALSGDAEPFLGWPFFQKDYGLSHEDLNRIGAKWATRFSRRIVDKARKERARTGQKQQRSNMPGTWVW